MGQAELILEDLKSGKKDAFRSLFDTYYLILVGFVNCIVHDADASKDIVQNCLVDFWFNKRYQKMTGGLDRYLGQMSKHAAMNYLRGLKRRDKHHQIAMDIYEEEESVDEEERQEQLALIYMAINSLPEERRKIFLMVIVEGKKYREVAEVLQISINTVKTQISRALSAIRETLKVNNQIILCFFSRK